MKLNRESLRKLNPIQKKKKRINEKRFCYPGTSKKNEEDLKRAKRLKTGPGPQRNVEVKVGVEMELDMYLLI